MASTMTKQELLQLMAARKHAEDGTGRTIRESAGVSLAEMAAVLGTTVTRLRRWEANEVTVRGPVAVQWVDLLDDLAKRAEYVSA